MDIFITLKRMMLEFQRYCFIYGNNFCSFIFFLFFLFFFFLIFLFSFFFARHLKWENSAFLNAVLEFLRYDNPVGMTGEHFERQIASLFQILWISEVEWRKIQVGERDKWGEDKFLSKHLTLFNLLNREDSSAGWCFEKSVSAAFNKPLKFGINDMFLHKEMFQTGCDLSKLYYGIHFPSAKNHPGFDAFLRLALASGDNLLVVVENKYTEGFSPFFYFLFFYLFQIRRNVHLSRRSCQESL